MEEDFNVYSSVIPGYDDIDYITVELQIFSEDSRETALQCIKHIEQEIRIAGDTLVHFKDPVSSSYGGFHNRSTETKGACYSSR